jgi:hypothetical protein
MSRVFRGLLLLCLMLLAASAARGEELQLNEEFPNQFMIRAGYNYVFNANTVFGINSENGVTGSVDFANLLGGKTVDTHSWRIDSLYRFNPRHSLGFSYYHVGRDGERTLLQDITIDNITYKAGAQVLSEIGISLYRLLYNYSFYHKDKVELGISGGLYVADINIALHGTLTCSGGPSCTPGPVAAGGSSNTLAAPLPNLGFLLNYDITPRLQTQFRLDWFYIDVPKFQGSMTDVYLGLEYRLFKHFALGTAFDRFNVNVNYTPKESSGWQVINNWSSINFYGAAYF